MNAKRTGVYVGMSTQALTELLQKTSLSDVRSMIDAGFSKGAFGYDGATRLHERAQEIYQQANRLLEN